MESLLRQGKQVCPFLKRSSPATLRMMSTAYTQTSARGIRVSALQAAATHCPVVGKALESQMKRSYVTKSSKVNMDASHPAFAESATLEETHRAAGVTDMSKGISL